MATIEKSDRVFPLVFLVFSLSAIGYVVRLPHRGHMPTDSLVQASALATTKSPLLEGKRVDINSADALQLDAVPKISAKMAEKIVELRNRRGRFRSIDDLLDVKGIGPKKLEAIRPYLMIE